MNIFEILRKNRTVLLYIIFGVLTTAVNMAAYFLCYERLGIPNVPSTVIAWLLSVLFAFVTNKLFVFDSRSLRASVLLRELWTFFACRILTGVLDTAIMFAAVDVLGLNSTLWKFISNVIVIVLNYIFSKLIIFKK